MPLRTGSILFFAAAIVLGIVRFTLSPPHTGILVDAAFITAATCFIVCAVGYLGRRLADVVRTDDAAGSDGPGRSTPPRCG